MSQNDYTIANQTTPLFRADLNNALQALASNSSGPTAPTTTYANMTWYDTGTNTLYMRSEADDAWIALGTLNQSTNTFTPAGSLALASQAEAEAGTDNTKVMTPLRVEQNFAANEQQIGVGQTWQNLIGSRLSNTTYQNTTGKPIMVSCSTSALNSALRVSSDNVTFIDVATRGNSSKETIVPNNHYYRLFNDNDNVTHWSELR